MCSKPFFYHRSWYSDLKLFYIWQCHHWKNCDRGCVRQRRILGKTYGRCEAFGKSFGKSGHAERWLLCLAYAERALICINFAESRSHCLVFAEKLSKCITLAECRSHCLAFAERWSHSLNFKRGIRQNLFFSTLAAEIFRYVTFPNENCTFFMQRFVAYAVLFCTQ